MRPERSGEVAVLGHHLFYRSFGPEKAAPVLALHGGPGASHDYLLPLVDLTDAGFRVVLFDQLGCGSSEVPDDRTLFSLEHHVAETDGIRRALGLGPVHLVGSSYGGLLAIAVALAHPASLRSLTTVGGLASVPLASAEMARLVRELPTETQATLRRCEAGGTTGSAEYQAAAMEFYRRHLCRLPTWPTELTRSLELAMTHPVYPYMNGPSEFTITGTIREIDLSARLGEIRRPTLVLGGRSDEVTPRVAEQIRQGIPGAQGVTFEESSHVPFWEERARFMSVVASFLTRVDAVHSRRPADGAPA
ncbi:MAG TPA: proline iminopeptidase-family hydrolase [Thermoplasmata archaeon]|nr:proline iminopeptidase-family hydrolase [Thermoplasmata archaeon]